MKTYCISDIHGHLDNLNRFIETLNEDDRIFVLGDVIDKGPKAIECLKLIMDDSRFTMLLGNHEYMMFNLLSAEPCSYTYNDAFDLWINYNEGGDTLDAYNELPRYMQLRIYDYLKKLPLNIPDLKVGNNKFYLVHSYPHSDIKLTMADVEYSDIKISSYVWDRVNSPNQLEIKNRIVVAGHTPVQLHLGLSVERIKPVSDNQHNFIDSKYIDIDGGLATNLDNSKLIALCLNDLNYELY